MLKINTLIFILTVIGTTTSCATIFRRPKSRDVVNTVTITSIPSDAEVYSSKGLVGKTPLVYNHTGRKTDVIQIKKEGYLDGYENINRKNNTIWTVVTFVTGTYPGLGIPILIDHLTGSIYDISTDSIHVNLISNNINVDSVNHIETNLQNITSNFNYPALEILTGAYRIKVLPNTRVKLELKNGKSLVGLITEIQNDYFVLKKGKQKVQYSSIKSFRFYNQRLWYPILTSITIFPPIIWFVSGKVAEQNSTNCKRNIKKISIVEGVQEYEFGKVKCR